MTSLSGTTLQVRMIDVSDNSVAPHPHFHVMGGPQSLVSNGLP